MQTVADFPYWEVQFSEAGLPDANDRQRILAEIPAEAPTDLSVLSHGWRNDLDDARGLYRALLGNMRARLGAAGGAERRFAVLGVLWPSMKFADPDELPHAQAAAAAAMGNSSDVPADALRNKVAELGRFLGVQDRPELASAIEAAGELGSAAGAGGDPRQRLLDCLQKLLPPPSDPKDDASDRLFKKDNAAELFENLKEPLTIADTRDGGGAAGFDMVPTAGADQQGEAAGLGSLFSGVRAAAWRILNYATYYVMKERAGKVGNGLNALLGELRAKCPDLRIHLVGHSFGARLVTAAAAGPERFGPASLSLLQAAYSHNGLGPGVPIDNVPRGYFRAVIDEQRVRGPIIATHTQNDKAVGIAYAIASRLSGDRAAAFGGPDDVFGGIGRNGAVRMGAGETVQSRLAAGTSAYPAWAPGKVTNLLADDYVHSHGDVTNPAVANAVLHATGT